MKMMKYSISMSNFFFRSSFRLCYFQCCCYCCDFYPQASSIDDSIYFMLFFFDKSNLDIFVLFLYLKSQYTHTQTRIEMAMVMITNIECFQCDEFCIDQLKCLLHEHEEFLNRCVCHTHTNTSFAILRNKKLFFFST